MRRSAPNQQKHADDHTYGRRDQEHDRHLPGHDLEQTRSTAAGPRRATTLSKEFVNIDQAITV
jgi:hypothetical protein